MIVSSKVDGRLKMFGFEDYINLYYFVLTVLIIDMTQVSCVDF